MKPINAKTFQTLTSNPDHHRELIASIPEMDRKALLDLWLSILQTPPPKTLSSPAS